MKSKKIISRSSSFNKFLIPVICLVIGAASALSVTKILASNTIGVIHGCVDKKGNLRVISDTDICDKKETPLDWNIQGSTGSTSSMPFTCLSCSWKSLPEVVSSKFHGKDMTDAILPNNLFGTGSDLSSINFTGVSLTLTQCQGSCNFSNTNFSNSDMTRVDLTGGSVLDPADRNANFQNANFTNSNISGGRLDGGDFSGAIWSNTTCPDNTNSDNNSGHTCVGHLTP